MVHYDSQELDDGPLAFGSAKPSFASGKSGSFTQVSKYDTTSDWDLARLRYLTLDAPASWRAANEAYAVG
jgi:hypothetical protein